MFIYYLCQIIDSISSLRFIHSELHWPKVKKTTDIQHITLNYKYLQKFYITLNINSYELVILEATIKPRE